MSKFEKFLTEQELADLLGIPPRTLSQWRWLGKGPAFVKLGRHVRYEPTAVEAWLASQRSAA